MLEGFTLLWWHWLVLGIVLLALELLTPGVLLLFFFGVGAIVVGILAGLGIAGPLPVQVGLFAILSLVSLFALRKLMLSRLNAPDPSGKVDRLVGEMARVIDDIAEDALGKVELRGTPWNARNVGGSPLTRDQLSRVVKVDGLTLWVRGE